MKHAKPNSHQSQEHQLEHFLPLITLNAKGEPQIPTPIHRTHKLAPPLSPSPLPHPINRSESPLSELQKLDLHTRILTIGLATLINQGRSISEILKLADKEKDYTTETLIRENTYLAQRLAQWIADHQF